MNQFKIATLNIQQVISEDRIIQITNYIRSRNFDVVALQEVRFYVLPSAIKDFKIISNPHPEGGGTAFIYKAALNLSLVTSAGGGRILVARLGKLEFVNIYAPSGCVYIKKRKEFFQSTIFPYLCRANTIMLGDFNAVTRTTDRREKGAATGKPNEELKSVISAFGLHDAWIKLRKGRDLFYRS